MSNKKVVLAGLKPQTELVYDALISNSRGLSPRQADYLLGVRNLSARVSELRDQGLTIETVPMKTRKGSRYVMVNG